MDEQIKSKMKDKYIKYIFMLFVIFLLWSCNHTLFHAEQEVITSPNGTNTIIVKYDFVSRPTYQKGFQRNKKVWDYEGSGFMETVYLSVEWLSENQIRFSYDDTDDKYDEEYIITLDEWRSLTKIVFHLHLFIPD